MAKFLRTLLYLTLRQPLRARGKGQSMHRHFRGNVRATLPAKVIGAIMALAARLPQSYSGTHAETTGKKNEILK